MRTAPKTKHTIPWEQLQKQNIPYHENSSKKKNMIGTTSSGISYILRHMKVLLECCYT
jgi:hypothetical protein